MEIEPCEGGFSFACGEGTRGFATKILLATGLVDELPELPGIKKLYGVSVHHCLYCDGYEYARRPVAAYGKGDKGADGMAIDSQGRLYVTASTGVHVLGPDGKHLGLIPTQIGRASCRERV